MENYSSDQEDDESLDEDAEQRKLCSDFDQTLDQLRIYELIIELRDLLAKNIKHENRRDDDRMNNRM